MPEQGFTSKVLSLWNTKQRRKIKLGGGGYPRNNKKPHRWLFGYGNTTSSNRKLPRTATLTLRQRVEMAELSHRSESEAGDDWVRDRAKGSENLRNKI